MDLLRNSLRPLNWDLSLAACPIFSYKWKSANWLLKFHGFILICIHITFVFNQASDIGVRNNVPQIIRFMMIAWNLWGCIYSVSLIVAIWKTRVSIRMLLNDLSKYLSNTDHRIILHFTTKLLLHKLLYTLLVRIPYLVLIYWDSFHSLHWIGFNLNQITVIYYQVHDPPLVTLHLYLTLLKILYLAESNIIAELKQDILKQSSRVVYCKVKQCVEFKDNVSKHVSFFVGMAFGYLFVHAVCSICRFQFVYFDSHASTPAKTWALLAVGRLAIHFAQAVFLVFMTDQLSQESQKNMSSLADTIILLRNTQKWAFVLDEIKVAQRYRYRAGGFFSIDRNILISFVSSFVSLTALFIQLINQAMPNTSD